MNAQHTPALWWFERNEGIPFPVTPSLRTLALEALHKERARDPAPDSVWNDADTDAFEARQNFLSALREATGIDDALWRKLGVSILP